MYQPCERDSMARPFVPKYRRTTSNSGSVLPSIFCSRTVPGLPSPSESLSICPRRLFDCGMLPWRSSS